LGVEPLNDQSMARWLSLEQGIGWSILDIEYPIGQAGGEYVSPGMNSGTIVAIAMPGMSAAAQLIQFDRAGIAVSAGSACSSGSLKPSRVLKAFGIPDAVAARTIRVSFGWNTTGADAHAFQQAWLEIAEQAKARA